MTIGEQATRASAMMPSTRSITSSQLHIGGGNPRTGLINDSMSEYGFERSIKI